jgi:hypothetical protein
LGQFFAWSSQADKSSLLLLLLQAEKIKLPSSIIGKINFLILFDF